MRKVLLFLSLLVIARTGTRAQSPQKAIAPVIPWDTYSDTWTATDALGRVLPTFEKVGGPRKDRYVGVFYFLWLGAHVNGGPYDIPKIIAQHPDAMQHPDDPLWGPLGAPHHWGESLFGYYLTDDSWVLRKHAQMLADAGVDVIIFDVTNQITYKSYYNALLKTFAEVRAAGGKTPQVAFLTPFWDPAKVVRELWHDLYEPGLYKDLWFQWEGKPLLLADASLLAEGEGTNKQNTPVPLKSGQTLGQSFHTEKTFDAVGGRFPTFSSKNAAMTLTLYREGSPREKLVSKRFENIADNSWLSLHADKPLPPGNYLLEMSEPKGQIGWWSHTDDVYPNGQAYAGGAPVGGDRALKISVLTGNDRQLKDFFTFRKPQPDYFQGPTAPDMWSWLEIYPQHVFRNAKGEKEQMSVGVAQNAVDHRLATLSEKNARGRNWHNGANDTRPNAELEGLNFAEQFELALKEDPKLIFITGWNEWIAGRFAEFAGVKEPVMFVDEYNQEFSRDIEPMQGGHGDNYYYQMVSFIRRYKGARKPPVAGPAKTIKIDGDFSDWANVAPEFRDDVGDTAWRDHPGWNNVAHYVDKTGRNDFVLLKAARDRENLYFYARTRDPITPYTGPGWMLLFLNVGGDRKKGWEGYNFVVNRSVVDSTTSLLESSSGGWNWQTKARIHYMVRGNEMELAIPRAALGLNEASRPLHFEFKWADNMQREGDIMEFLRSGDAAPNGRFNYLYREK